jgi:hypothetical protein
MAKNDIIQHQFAKGFDPKRNIKGAPRKLISTLSGLGYSSRQVSDTMLNLLALTESEVASICENDNFSMLERIIAKALIKDFSKGSLWNIETLLSRSIGRPKETTAVEQDNKLEVVFVKGKTIL